MTTVSVLKDDVGTELVFDCGADVSSATVRRIYAKPPYGGMRVWDAELEGTHFIKYLTKEGDLDITGRWKLQVYIEMPGWKGRGDYVTLRVNR